MEKFDEEPIIVGGRVEKATQNLKFGLENK